jgi:hypothetical protein
MAKPKMSRQEWQEHAAEKVAAAQEVLEREVASIQSGEDWKRFLDFQSKLHTYSPNNVLLIWRQHVQAFSEGRVTSPEPTYVAGFRTWQALGRQVERGQHGYAVLAPVRRTERVATDAGGNVRRLGRDDRPGDGEVEHARQVLRGFKVEHVFEATMTRGDPLPVPPTPRLLEGEGPAGLAPAVLGLLEARGFTVDTVPDASHIQGANGQTNHGSKTVLVRSDMDDAAMVKTLLHEAAHVLLHDEAPGMFLPRARKEVEAESVAYVVAAAHGMATDDYSFPYVATWAGTTGQDAAKEVAATQTRVASAAKALLDVSPAEHTAGGKVPGVEAAIAAARDARVAARQADPTSTPQPVEASAGVVA